MSESIGNFPKHFLKLVSSVYLIAAGTGNPFYTITIVFDSF